MKIKKESVAKAKEKARKLFLEKKANCAESVFRAVHELVQSNLPPEVSSLLTPLGGGVGITGENCGAMLAGVMALALVHGRKEESGESLGDHRKRLWATYSLYNRFPHLFKEKFGTVRCWDLTKPYVYGTKECREYCENLVAETAGMVIELLLEAEENGLRFPFGENLLLQASEATGIPVEELIRHKERGEPFPCPKK